MSAAGYDQMMNAIEREKSETLKRIANSLEKIFQELQQIRVEATNIAAKSGR